MRMLSIICEHDPTCIYTNTSKGHILDLKITRNDETFIQDVRVLDHVYSDHTVVCKSFFFCPKLPPSKVLVNYRANSNLHSESSAVIYWTLSNNSLIQRTWMFRLRIMTQPWTTFILLTIHYKLDGSIIDRELLGLIKTYVLLNVKRIAWRECLGSPTLLFIDNFSWKPVRDIIRCWIVCKVRLFQGQNWPSTEATTGYLKLLIDCSPLRITGFTNYLRFSRFHVWKC